MRITLYIHKDDISDLNRVLSGDDSSDGIRILNKSGEDFLEVSITYDEYVRCLDLEVFDELLSL